MPLEPNSRIRYLGSDVFDRLIRTGDLGVVLHVSNGWVHARWERDGNENSVPETAVEPVD